MKPLVPASEEFFYWDPEAICSYPSRDGIEEEWFIRRPGDAGDESAEHPHIFEEMQHEVH
jgi:hypothetical protein